MKLNEVTKQLSFARKVEKYINKNFYVYNDKFSGDQKIDYTIEERKAQYRIMVYDTNITVVPDIDSGATVKRAKEIKAQLSKV